MIDETGSRKSLLTYTVELQRRGRYWFSKEQAIHALQVNDLSFKKAVSRLIKNKKVTRIKRDFFVIVPPEYFHLGILPAEWFIDAWMSYNKQQYYVALLSAAALHSAAHQQPQEFQVMVDKRLRKITSGKLSIRFFYKKKITQTPIQKIKTNTGYIKVSTPESTAFDLVQYIKSAGNLGNVATVLYELSDKIDPVALLDMAVKNNLDFSCIQRLGFILNHIGKSKLVAPLLEWVSEKNPPYVLLSSGSKNDILKRDLKWKILVNEVIEVDQ